MNKEQSGHNIHQRRKNQKILALVTVICLLLIFCSFILFTGIAQNNAHAATLINPMDAQVTATSPAMTVTASFTVIASSTTRPTLVTVVVEPTVVLQQGSSQGYVPSLFSGLVVLIAALIGGVLTYFGSMNAVKKQIDHLHAQQTDAMRNSLLVEVQENLDLLQNKRRKVLLSTEAWSTYKGNIAAFSDTLRNELIKLYSEVKRYNSVQEQVHAMHLNKMDNNALFPLQEEMGKELISISNSVLKKLLEK